MDLEVRHGVGHPGEQWIVPAEHATTAQPAPASWGAEFRATVGDAKAVEFEGSPWWPSLVDVVNQGLEVGVPLRDLLSVDSHADVSLSDDHCEILVRRAQQLTTALPDRADEPKIRRLEQRAEERWREWADQTNPAWVKSEYWPAIAYQLNRVDPAVVDIDSLT